VLVLSGMWAVGSVTLSAATTGDDSPLETARRLNEAFVQAVEKVSPAVVVIRVTHKAVELSGGDDDRSFLDLLPPQFRRRFELDPDSIPREWQPPDGQGSGVVISEDGYILTNFHVVEDAEEVSVRFKDGRHYEAVVRGLDRESDLAVLKIEASGVPHATLGDSSGTRVGEFAIAIGAPFSLDHSVTFGHVSAKGRAFEMRRGVYVDQDFIQTDASINPGNSGGPLINIEGEVIGINTMIRGLNTGIGFAIPSDLARLVSGRLIAEGRFTRSWLGVGIRGLRDDPEYQELFREIEDGVVIGEIMRGSPAARSELKPSDVVLSVDGRRVATPRELKEQISVKAPGSTVELDVMRMRGPGEFERLKIAVVTDALPEGNLQVSRRAGQREVEEERALGLTVRPLTPEAAREQEVERGSGVLVTAVAQGSPAAEKGIEPGTVITAVNGEPVSSPREFREAVGNADMSKGVVINLVTRGVSRFQVLKGAGE
jgi:serine protease Do